MPKSTKKKSSKKIGKKIMLPTAVTASRTVSNKTDTMPLTINNLLVLLACAMLITGLVLGYTLASINTRKNGTTDAVISPKRVNTKAISSNTDSDLNNVDSGIRVADEGSSTLNSTIGTWARGEPDSKNSASSSHIIQPVAQSPSTMSQSNSVPSTSTPMITSPSPQLQNSTPPTNPSPNTASDQPTSSKLPIKLIDEVVQQTIHLLNVTL